MVRFGSPRWLLAGLILTTAACHPKAMANTNAPDAPAASQDNKQPDLMSRDGIRIGARYYPAEKPKALILLFHQAGSSKDEYAKIAPRLVAGGFSALAIDQHSGGSLFGRNETVARIGQAMSFEDARQDLDVALDWASQRGLPVIVWGSSYSAALAFELVADNPGRIAGLLAFSPGEFLKGATRVRNAARRIQVPVYVTMASGEEEQARQIFDAIASKDKVLGLPAQRGVHGSATLDPDRNPEGAKDNWRSAEAFLRHLKLVPQAPAG